MMAFLTEDELVALWNRPIGHFPTGEIIFNSYTRFAIWIARHAPGTKSVADIVRFPAWTTAAHPSDGARTAARPTPGTWCPTSDPGPGTWRREWDSIVRRPWRRKCWSRRCDATDQAGLVATVEATERRSPRSTLA